MTGRITRWLWLAFAAIAIGLPFLPLARPNGAPPPDLGPPWAPNVTAWGIGLALVLVAAVASGRLAKGLPARRIGIGPRLSSPVFLTLLAVGLAAWSVYTVRSVFASNPVLIDEMAQLFHARVFASASLAAPAPEPAAAFLIQHTWITDAGWVSLYPPGHPLALAIGMVLRAEWLVDPVLGGVCVFLVYLVAKGLYGPKTARIAALLWAISAWVMFMSASYMNHVTATTLALACWALVWAPRPPGRLHVVAAGLCLAAVAATRPLDAVAAGLPVLVWIVARRRWAVIPWMALGTLPVVIAFGYFNWRLFGGPLTLGYNALYGSELNLGFGIDPWGRPFTPVVALANLAVAMRRLHLFLYEWPIPALLPLGLWALAGRQRRAADAIVAIGLLAVPALYFFYWHSGYYPGPRFYYGAAPFLIIGTARAWRWGWALARRSSRPWWRGDVALVSAAVIVLIWGWAGVLPARFAAFRTGLATLKLHPERELAARGVRQALVIVPERWGSRLVVSLWELGIRPGLAERAFNWLDACDLQRFVDAARAAHMSAEEATRRVEAAIRATPVPVPRSPGSPDETLHLRTDRPLDAVCQREVQRDQAGFTLFGYLAWRNAIGLHSGIVVARDLYERNAELFARYPGWAIWRYAPPASNPNALPILTQVVTP